MKVLVVTPGFSWASSDMAQYAAEALRDIGCEVSVYDLLQARRFFEELKPSETILKNLSSERLALQVLEQQPDLLFVVHGGRLPGHVVRAVKRCGTRTAVWLLDDPQEIDTSSLYAQEYDYVFTVERRALDRHRREGSRQVFFLPTGCDPRVHRPRPVKGAAMDRYKSDVCLVGSGFMERVRLLTEIEDFLCGLNVKLVGLWDHLPGDSKLRQFVSPGIVTGEEVARYYSGAKIVLNPHRDGNGLSLSSNLWDVPATCPNPRVFEASACGAFMLVNRSREGISEFFEEDKEIAFFEGPEELRRKIHYWLDRPHQRRAVADAARQRAVCEHTYARRMARLMDAVAGASSVAAA